MNQKLLTYLLIILILINIIAMTFLFIDIQVIAAPETQVTITIKELTEQHIIINTTLNIKNPNMFALAITDFTVATYTSTGKPLGTILLKGGYLESDDIKTFSSQDAFTLTDIEIDEITNLTTNIDGKVKVRFFGIIEKTVPFEITLDTLINALTETIAVPKISLNAAVENISEDGVIFSGSVNIDNPNLIPIHLTNIHLNVTNANGTSYGLLSIQNGTAPAEDSITLPISGTIDFQALNIQTLTVNISATAGATIANLKHTIPIHALVYFDIPDINDIISLDEALGIFLQGDFLLRFRGIIITVTLLVENPSSLPLASRDLVCTIARVENDQRIPIGQKNMTACILKGTNETCVVANITLPYRSLHSSKPFQFLPDYLAISITGDFALEGVNQALPLELNGYLNPHIFRKP